MTDRQKTFAVGPSATRRATVTRLRPKTRPTETAAESLRSAAPEPEFLRDSYGSTAFAEVIDRSLHAAMARFTAGLAPMTLIGAYADWGRASRRGAREADAACGKSCAQVAAAGELRPRAARWKRATANPASRRWLRTSASRRKSGSGQPYDVICQSFLLGQQWWHNAMTTCAACCRSTSRWLHSAPGSGLTCSRRRTTRSQP